MKGKKKEIILGALLVAIAFALWHNLGGGDDTARTAGPARTGGTVARVKIDDIKLPNVNWAALSAPRPVYDPNGRNIFTWGVIPVPTPPPKPQPPAINYKFIGYFGPSENKIAILNDGTDLIFVRQGEKLGGQFKILEIGYESVKFGYTDPKFKGETTTLPMSSSP